MLFCKSDTYYISYLVKIDRCTTTKRAFNRAQLSKQQVYPRAQKRKSRNKLVLVSLLQFTKNKNIRSYLFTLHQWCESKQVYPPSTNAQILDLFQPISKLYIPIISERNRLMIITGMTLRINKRVILHQHWVRNILTYICVNPCTWAACTHTHNMLCWLVKRFKWHTAQLTRMRSDSSGKERGDYYLRWRGLLHNFACCARRYNIVIIFLMRVSAVSIVVIIAHSKILFHLCRIHNLSPVATKKKPSSLEFQLSSSSKTHAQKPHRC